jgi:hypothetical protein
MDRLQVIIKNPDDYNYRHQEILDRTFVDLCGEYPGAVPIRRSESVFKGLKKLDQEENERRSAEQSAPTLTDRVINSVLRPLWSMVPWPTIRESR